MFVFRAGVTGEPPDNRRCICTFLHTFRLGNLNSNVTAPRPSRRLAPLPHGHSDVRRRWGRRHRRGGNMRQMVMTERAHAQEGAQAEARVATPMGGCLQPQWARDMEAPVCRGDLTSHSIKGHIQAGKSEQIHC